MVPLTDSQSNQLELFKLIKEKTAIQANNKNGAEFSNPAFAGNKIRPIHRWVPWIAGFSSDFVKDALHEYLHNKGVVLDPFSGVGTTLVDAVLDGHNAVGFEINPYAALACHAKAHAHRIDINILQKNMLKLKEFYKDKASSNYIPISEPPKGFKTRAEFYSPAVLGKVLIIQDFINSIESPDIQELFRLAFASTMVRYSNYSYEPSVGRRVSAGKDNIEDFPVGETILNKLIDMAEDIAWFKKNLPASDATVRIINASFFEYESHLTPESVDVIITSPPYLNNYHYNRNTRPQLYWLGYAENPRDLKPLENSNFGKYWQTVRGQECLELGFLLPDSDLEDTLKLLRTLHAEKGVYGGNGWANYAAAYFRDCHTFAQGINYALKPGSTALVVIGNSILQGVSIPTDVYFGKIAESIGLELVDIHIPRATRVGNSIIQSDVRVTKAKNSHQLYEAVVELRKR